MEKHVSLDALPPGQSAVIRTVEWQSLSENEAQRLRALGIDQGATVQVEHRGLFGGRDPLAVSIGRMKVALRRNHAFAIAVEALP